MDHRIGKCSQCGAEFKVPASFTHDVARCKVCSGVVRFDPAAAPAVPAKRVVKAPEAEPALEEVRVEETERKRKERGTLARLKAERARAAAGSGESAARPAGTGVGKAAAAAGTAAAGAATARTKTAAGKSSRGVTGARSGGARRSGSSNRRGRGASGDGERSSRRGGRSKGRDAKKKSPVLPLILVGVAGLGAAGWFFKDTLLGKDTQAGGPEESTEQALDPGAAAPEAGADPAADTQVAATPQDEPATAGGDEAAAAPEEAAPQEAEGSDEAAAAPDEEAKPAEEAKSNDPASVDLSEIEDFGPARGTTDEEWTRIQELADTFGDPYAGAQGGRAGKELKELSRKAMPALINKLKTFDIETDEGYRMANVFNKTMQEICNGNNFGWKSNTEDNYVIYDKKIVVAWAGVWRQVEQDIIAWINLAKLKDKDPEHAQELLRLYGDGAAADEGGGDEGDEDEGFDVD